MQKKSSHNSNVTPNINSNNGFWHEWFQNSETALEQDKEMIRKSLKKARNIDPESILSGQVKL